MPKKQLRAPEATLDLILDVEAPNRFIGVWFHVPSPILCTLTTIYILKKQP